MKNLCLIIHCLRDGSLPPPRVHKELFIPLADVDGLLGTLKSEGYRFKLPGDTLEADGPVCSITFDDGYFNICPFLEIAEKHAVPFILFLTSYNVARRVPFIWDIWEATRKERWPISSADYRGLYERMTPSERVVLDNDTHRPFTPEELDAFAAHPLAHLAPHGHMHQPAVGKYFKDADADIEANLAFLSNYGNALAKDFALPCGFYTGRVRRRLLGRFDRLYTADGGYVAPGDRVIHRISLIAPDIGGPLRDQIRAAVGLKAKLIRRARTLRYSNRWLSRIP